jgi:hypothetical protein
MRTRRTKIDIAYKKSDATWWHPKIDYWAPTNPDIIDNIISKIFDEWMKAKDAKINNPDFINKQKPKFNNMITYLPEIVAKNFVSDFTWKMKHLNTDPFVAGKELAIRAVMSILNTPMKSIDNVFWSSVLEELQK